MADRNFTPRQILNRAIGKEAEAKMMYEIYAEKVEDPRSKQLLKELALEEMGHKLALEKVDPEHPGTFKSPNISSSKFSDFSERPQITNLRKLASEEKKHKQKLERMYDDMFQPEN
ncbi:MAG: hypothetical protein HY801_03695 [Candidatus Lindowbacteria bacterium]|nr:hypothetical protein [Candidatus Lindowbacteria bacterium]